MDKSKLLLVSIGQGGSNIVDGMLSKNKRYNGLFINSSIGDIKPLKNAKLDKNVFIYPGADGSGRDRVKSEEMFLENTNTLGMLLRRFPQTEVVVVFASMSGGTGSGSISKFIQLTKKALPTAKINVVAILPSLTEDELSLRNSLECWNDLNKVINLISDIKLVDNSKRNSYAEINKEVIDSLDLAYNIMGVHQDGTIDQNDSKRINTAEGYGLVIKLGDDFTTSKEAIDNAIENSVFAQVDNYDCDYLGINIKPDNYNIQKIAEEFEVFKTTYKTYNSKENYLVLGGLEMPTECVELIKMTLDDKTKKKGLRTKTRQVIIDIDDEVKNKNDESPKIVDIYDEDEDFDDLFDDSWIDN